MDVEIAQIIKDQIENNDIILYMKGTPEEPRCGFSGQASSLIMKHNIPFAYVDVLDNPEIRSTLPAMSNWPTFPQLYVKGELVGGCDIMVQLEQDGELKKILQQALTVNPSNQGGHCGKGGCGCSGG